ncbi:hypothetical protein DRO02_01335 [archaeon]|nr:MAG: hypothetical protein DRO21_03840 [archaeon]RLG65622.1 MAG: hypothetical protein DRO02_01335 [archaeon]
MCAFNINVFRITLSLCIILIITNQLFVSVYYEYSSNKMATISERYRDDWSLKRMLEWSSYMGDYGHSRFIHSMHNFSSLVNCSRYHLPKLNWKYIKILCGVDDQVVFSKDFMAFPIACGGIVIVDLDTMESYIGAYPLFLPWVTIMTVPKCLAIINDTFLVASLDTLVEYSTVIGLVDMRNPTWHGSNILQFIWSRILNCKGAPVFSVYDKYIIMALSNGSIVCLDWWFGDIIWSRNLYNACFSGVSCWGELAFVACILDGVYCLNISSGDVVWRLPLREYFYSVPIVIDGVLYVGGGHRVYCIDALSGKLVWSSDFLKGYVINMAWHYSGIFVLTDNRTLYKLDAENGSIIWFINDDRLEDYIQVSDYIVNCEKLLVDPWTGKIYDMPEGWKYVKLISSDLIYVITNDGKLKLMEPSIQFYVIESMPDEVEIYVNESLTVQILVDVNRYFEYSILIESVYNESVIACNVSDKLIIEDKLINFTIRGLHEGKTDLIIKFKCPCMTVMKAIKVTVKAVENVKPPPSQEGGYNIVPYMVVITLIAACAIYAFMRARGKR